SRYLGRRRDWPGRGTQAAACGPCARREGDDAEQRNSRTTCEPTPRRLPFHVFLRSTERVVKTRFASEIGMNLPRAPSDRLLTEWNDEHVSSDDRRFPEPLT